MRVELNILEGSVNLPFQSCEIGFILRSRSLHFKDQNKQKMINFDQYPLLSRLVNIQHLLIQKTISKELTAQNLQQGNFQTVGKTVDLCGLAISPSKMVVMFGSICIDQLLSEKVVLINQKSDHFESFSQHQVQLTGVKGQKGSIKFGLKLTKKIKEYVETSNNSLESNQNSASTQAQSMDKVFHQISLHEYPKPMPKLDQEHQVSLMKARIKSSKFKLLLQASHLQSEKTRSRNTSLLY